MFSINKMSLNKVTNLDKKSWMNISCKDIVCESITITGGDTNTHYKEIDANQGNPYNALDLSGVQTLFNEVSGSNPTVTSLSGGVKGQVVQVFVGVGANITFLHNTSTGLPGEQVIFTNGSIASVNLYPTGSTGFTNGWGSLLCLSPQRWILNIAQPSA